MNASRRDAAVLRRYWNERGDPLDWKRPADAADDVRWQAAHAAFLAPDTQEGLAALGAYAGRRVLEIGCGAGHGSLHLARSGAELIGLDVADARCAVAARRLAEAGCRRARFVAGRAEELPFADGAFDAVFCCDVLMYAAPERVAAECHRVLAAGGRAVFIESLAGSAPLALYRRASSPAAYLRFTRHLHWRELSDLGPPLVLRRASAHYLSAIVAFVALFVLRSSRLHRACLALLTPLDRWCLDRWPVLAGCAWRGVAIYDKPAERRG